jgi:hypothetical protein
MNFTLTITPSPELAELLQGLTNALVGIKETSEPIVESPKTSKGRSKKPVPELPLQQTSTPASTQNEDEKDEETEAHFVHSAPDVKVTLEQLRAAAKKAAERTKDNKKVKAILDKYGYPSVSEVAEKDRAAFINDLNAL